MSNAAVMLYDGSVDQDILDEAERLGVICIQVEPEYLLSFVTSPITDPEGGDKDASVG